MSLRISLVIPVFNEQEAIPHFVEAVNADRELRGYSLELVFVNDGSTDRTAEVLLAHARQDERLMVINFSRNFGKEAALLAGITHATGDAVIPLDVDLQDPIEVIPQLVHKWREGHDVLLAKRRSRAADTFLKKWTAEKFYRFFNQMTDNQIEQNVGDFRLMSRRVIDEIKRLPERNLFMKGLLSWVGFETAIVEYDRPERTYGATKFNFWKLWNLALEGFTSFSTVPLRCWTYIGAFVAGFSLLSALWIVADKLIWGNPVSGYPSLMTAILFLGGVQLIGIGVLGEYIGRIYIESKERPRYIIASVISNKAVGVIQTRSVPVGEEV